MLDRHSEAIAHFVGAFDQEVEKSLLRLHYDELRAHQAELEDPAQLLQVTPKVKSDLTLDPFDPGVGYIPDFDMPLSNIHWPALWFPLLPDDQGDGPFGDGMNLKISLNVSIKQTVNLTPEPYSPYPTLDPLVLEMPAPGAMITINWQSNWAQDDDVIMQRELTLSPEIGAMRTQDALDVQLANLTTIADQLSPLDVNLNSPAGLPTLDTLGQTLAAFEGIESGETEGGAEVFIQHLNKDTVGSDALSSEPTLNGAAADDVPETLLDRLEARGPEEPEEEVTSNIGTSVSGDTVIGSYNLGPGEPEGAGAGLGDLVHKISMGENLLMNEFGMTRFSLDAPVIAVSGAARDLTVISQVNVASDRDFVRDGDRTHHHDPCGSDKDASTEAVNMAWIDWESNMAIGPSYVGPAHHEGGPVAWAIAELTGDLVFSSVTIQVNLISDNDLVTFETTYHSFDLATGDNVMTNLATLQSFHTGFDMILVGGDMMSFASIQQMNVLSDDDVVVGEAGTLGGIATSGNLLWNEATLSRSGVDHEVDMSESASAALANLENGLFNPGAFDGDSMFDGFYVPQILTISGDFISQTHLTQVNVLSDADTLQMYAGWLDALGMGRVEVSTGGNILANIANLNIGGLDSDVMANNGVYSDAVIYQAGMLGDGDAPFDLDFGGAGLGGLASEAVAFLADGMLSNHDNDDQDAGYDGSAAGGGSCTFDALNTMVV